MAVPVRKAKRLITFAGATLLGAFPAAGQQVADAERPTGSPACQGFTDNQIEAMTRCHLRELDKRLDKAKRETAIIKQEGAAAREQAAAARERADKNEEASRCIVFLTEGVKSGRFDKAEIHEKAGGKLSVENACPTAIKHFNYQRKAEAARPALK